jgi:hypothetical protein
MLSLEPLVKGAEAHSRPALSCLGSGRGGGTLTTAVKKRWL